MNFAFDDKICTTYFIHMKDHNWDNTKNLSLIEERGVSFEDVIVAIDEYEKDILASYENDELVSLGDAEITRHKAYAKNTLKKDKRISIRLSGRDLEGIQSKAAHEGIPYHTLIGSILHKHANGYLKEV